MSILDADIIQQTLPFEAMPDACLLERIDRSEVKINLHHTLPETVYVARGAELAGLRMIIWPCEWSQPHGDIYPGGYIMNSSLIEQPYDPRWGDSFPKEDFFSSYQHMEEIIERHTGGMLNMSRLKNLNRIYNDLKNQQ